jgi:hypothetical protein
VIAAHAAPLGNDRNGNREARIRSTARHDRQSNEGNNVMKDRFGNVPFALFRNHGREVAFTREDYEQAKAVARICRCGDCDCCRAVEYVREVNKEKDIES